MTTGHTTSVTSTSRRLRPNLALLVKTVAMAGGLAMDLNNALRLPAVLLPYAERMLLRGFSPVRGHVT